MAVIEAKDGVKGAEVQPPQVIVSAEPSPSAILRKRVFGHYGFMIGAFIVGTIMIIALLAPYISPHDPYDQVLSRKLIPPIWMDSAKATWEHPLGTDQLGRDYLSRLLWCARISLLIGFAAETDKVVGHAKAKLDRKGCDWIIANDVSGNVMGGADNSVHIITDAGVESWDQMPKSDVARKLAERIADALA